MLPLRYPRTWLGIGYALTIGTFVVTLLPELWPLDYEDKRWLMKSDKLIHGAIFFFLTIWFSGQYQRQYYVRLGAAMLFFGGFIEVCQSFTAYRTAELMDFVADAGGIGLGLLLALIGLGGWSLWIERKLAGRGGE